MKNRSRACRALCALGLLIALPCIAADDHKPAAAPGAPAAKAEAHAAKSEAPAAKAAPKGEAPAPKSAAKSESPTGKSEPAPKKSAVAEKPVERRPAEAHTPPRPRPYVSPEPQRVAVATPREAVAAAPAPAPAAAHAAHPPHWSYEGANGPHAWAKLSPEWAACGSGSRQSPIDIRDGMKVELDPIVFDYRPSSFKVIDNGHTIQANVGGWNSLRIMGRRFKLVQFHFHSPSEEMVDGKFYDMVAHLVHKDSEGRLAVVAVLVESGKRQPAIQTVLNNLPLEKGEEYPASSNIDPLQLLPENRKYFTYMGSLTTPPCTEDVLWIVMKTPVQATPDQLNLFARLYPMNARPIQETGDRVIKESN